MEKPLVFPTNLPPAEFMRRRIFARFACKTAMRKAPFIRLIRLTVSAQVQVLI